MCAGHVGFSPKGSAATKAKERKTVMRMGPDNGREVFYCGCIADSGRHVCPWPVLIQEMQPECDWWYAFANVHTPCPSVGGLGKPPRSLGCSVMWKQLAASGFTQCQYVWDNKGECRSAMSHRYTAVALTFFQGNVYLFQTFRTLKKWLHYPCFIVAVGALLKLICFFLSLLYIAK